MTSTAGPRPVRAPRGSELSALGWQQEAALRMLQNNLDPEVAEHPDKLVVYGGTGKAARDWASFDAMVRTLRTLRTLCTLCTLRTLLHQHPRHLGTPGTPGTLRRASDALHSTGPMPRLWKTFFSRVTCRLLNRLRSASRIARAPRANVVKPSNWKWLSTMMRSAVSRPTVCQMSHSVADQISPLSCSSAVGLWLKLS